MTTKILLKYNRPLSLRLREIGYSVTSFTEDNFDYFYPGVVPICINTYNEVLQSQGEIPALQGINIELTTKIGLNKAVSDSNLNIVKQYLETSVDNINKFRTTPFIIKPNVSHSAFDTYDFTYKVYTNSVDFFSMINKEEFSKFIESGDYKNYIIQQSLANSEGIINQLFVAGFVNSNSDIHHEGITIVPMVFDPRQGEERLLRGGEQTTNTSKYPQNFRRLNSTYNDSNDLSDIADFIKQIEILFKNNKISNVPFIFQAIVDPYDSTKCYLTDMAYKIRPFNYILPERREYLKDKLDFMYHDTKVLLFDTNHYTYPTIELPKGITESLKLFLEENSIVGDLFGTPNKLALPFTIAGKTLEEMQEKVVKLNEFLSTDY